MIQPPYTTGTATVTAGSAVVDGTTTAWALGLVNGGMFSRQGLAVPIVSVESDTSLTLAYPWPGGTGTGAYAIDLGRADAASAIIANRRLADLLVEMRGPLVEFRESPDGIWVQYRNSGTDEPWVNLILVEDLPDGPQGIQGLQGIQGERGEQGIQGIRGIQGVQGIQGLPGDLSQSTANGIYPRLDGANAGPLGAFRNKLINTHQHINLRGYVSNTATTAASQYTIDRWRVVVSGQRLTWTMDAAGVPTYTAPAGGVEQVIEAANIEAATYTLSWTGTATATVNGAAVAKGAQVALNGQANATVRFVGGTFSLPQLERGTIATASERRPLQIEQMLCGRYFQLFDISVSGAYPQGGSGAVAQATVNFVPPMRAAPVIAAGENVSVVNISNGTFTPAAGGRSVNYVIAQGPGAGNFSSYVRNYQANAEL